jgi:PAS domain S-box-containing protein
MNLSFQFTPFILPLLLASALAGAVSFYAWRNRSAHSALTLCLMSLVVAWWSLGSAIEIAALGLPLKMLWGKLQYLSITTIPGLWLIFVIQHTWRGRRIPRSFVAGLMAIPLLTVALAFTTEFHGLIWQQGIDLIAVQDFEVMDVHYGMGFQVYTLYTYVVLGAGMALVIHNLIRRKGIYRRQAILVLLAALAPWLGNALYISGYNPIAPLDLTPFAFTLSVVVMAWAIFGFRLMNLTPMARDLVVDEMQDGMLVLDAQDCIVDLNPAAQRLLGVQAAEVIGMTASQLLQRWPPLLDRYQREPDSLTQISMGEGSQQRWYELRLAPLHDALRRFIGQVVTIHDITEHKRIQEQLRQLSRAVEASPVSIVITDPEGKIQYVNPKFTQVTGYAASEVFGKNSSLLKTYHTPREVHQQLWQTIRQGREWHGEFCNRKKNGDLFWESASISPLTDSSGKITHYLAVKEDVTERKQIESRLQENEARFRQIVENASDMIARLTPDGYILYVNPTALRLFGYSEEELVTRHYLDLVAPQARSKMNRFYTRQVLAKIPNTYYEFPMLTSDGHEIWLGQNVQIIEDEQNVIGLQALARDITERKRFEEALALARDQAMEANRVKSQLLANVNHELRTPLGSILGYAELLRAGTFGPLADAQAGAVGQIIESVNYLTGIVNELLDAAQIEARKLILQMEECDPRQIVQQVEGNMSILAERKGLQLTSELADNLPAAVLGDERRLKQILINLVGNAIKFTKTGGVHIKLYAPDASHWAMQVSDTGVGIPPEAQVYIFEPFRQADNQMPRSHRGAGLGLSISRQLIELMGGQITLESEMGRGSTFTIWLPVRSGGPAGTKPLPSLPE